MDQRSAWPAPRMACSNARCTLTSTCQRDAQTTIGGRHHTPAWHRARMVTAVCSNLAIIMERTDEQILPAVYNFIGRTFDATPSQLGALTLSRAFTQAITSPVGGVLGEQ